MTDTELQAEVKREVLVIFINDVKHRTSQRQMTGGELMALGGVPSENHLFLDVPGPGDDRQIDADEPVRLHAGMHFYDVPIGNFG